MYQYTTISVRKNTLSQFYFFQTEDINLLVSQTNLRNDIMAHPGFISMNIEVSADKLTLIVKTNWMNQAAAESFNSRHRQRFEELLVNYLRRHDQNNTVTKATLPDPPVVKERKLALEVTAEEIAERAAKIIRQTKGIKA